MSDDTTVRGEIGGYLLRALSLTNTTGILCILWCLLLFAHLSVQLHWAARAGMPTFGLLEHDYEGDENAYVGHGDLFFKRFSFNTVKPLDKVISTVTHTALSRLLREKYPCKEIKDVKCSKKYSTDLNTSAFKATESQRQEICNPAEIADYYIKKAWILSQQVAVERTVEVPSTKVLWKCSNIVTKNKTESKQNLQEIRHDQVRSEAVDSSEKQCSHVSPVATKARPLKSLEECFEVEMMLAENCDRAKKQMEGNKDQKNLRIRTKRTIVEKVTVESKKTATEQGISAVADFFCKLFAGTPVVGYGDKPLQLMGGDPVHYAYIVTIESYMGIVERDPPLVHVISRILIRICEVVLDFEAVLLGKLMRSSQLLSLDEEKCTSFTEQLAAREDRRFTLIYERSIIKLFINLHVVGLTSGNIKLFTEKSLWNIVSLLVDGKNRTLGTAAVLLELVEFAGVQLMRLHPQRWSTAFGKISSTLLPDLQADVDRSDVRKTVGEDTIVSSLRHVILRHSATNVSAK
ncbi:hypothetical protein Y032_0025g1212 [Ancylostoma ceylanicum]|uniref:Uncharacterized protein n=1 Tax=Ancylostoma ceylanicum TaxID=53326 RepID=A0A016UUR5_9BILA|nr:hypothetical protein Y032_0025g1212 [Ancylostoma ceylanicum]